LTFQFIKVFFEILTFCQFFDVAVLIFLWPADLRYNLSDRWIASFWKLFHSSL